MGSQPGAGRPRKLIEYDGELLSIQEVMERTGKTYRQVYYKYVKNAQKSKPRKKTVKKTADGESKVIPDDIVQRAEHEKKDVMVFLEEVMNDTNVDLDRRMRAAQILIPFCHKKADGKLGKKDKQDEAAKEAGKGKFRSAKAPKIIQMGKK